MKYILAILFIITGFTADAQFKLGQYGLQPNNLQDPISTYIAKYGKGAWTYVTDRTELYAIPMARRDTGMVVYVGSLDSLFVLKGTALTNDKWQPFLKIGQTTYPTGAMLFGGSDGNIGYKKKFLFYDSINVSVGMGTQLPTSDLEVQQHTPVRTFRGILSSNYANNGSGALFSVKKARGEEDAPLILQNGDNIGSINAYGFNGSSYINSGQINWKVDSIATATIVPTSMRLSIGKTVSGATQLTDVLTLYYKGNVGIGTTIPNNSAVLELSDVNRGFLMPRMTTVQRDAIILPATGLQVYNTTTNTVDVYNGISWSVGGDMLLATVQTVTAAKTFLDGTMKLRNVANTFDGYFVNTNTANRIYTLQDATGTIALTNVPQTFTNIQTFSQIVTTSNALTATANAATVPITSQITTVTNNSAATLTITVTTASAVDGMEISVRILDFSAVAQTITWVNTESSGVAIPTTTNGSTTLPLTVRLQFNSLTTKWRCIGYA